MKLFNWLKDRKNKTFIYVKNLYLYLKTIFRQNQDLLRDTTITGLVIGLGIFFLKIDNSFAQGIGIAITIGMILSYLKEIKKIIKSK